MTSYVNQTLMSDESVVMKAKFTIWDNHFAIWLSFLTLVITLLSMQFLHALPWIGASLLISSAIIYITDKTRVFVVTSKRIIAKQGFLRREAVTLYFDMIEQVEIKQDFYELLMQFGDVVLVGKGGSRHMIEGVEDTLSLQNVINEKIANLKV